MKDISPALAAHMALPLTSLCTLVAITRRDGVRVAFTDHDRDVSVGGVTYLAGGAFTAARLTQTAALKTQDFDVLGLLGSGAIEAAEIEAGLYDHARVDVAVCNWAAPEQGLVRLRRGWLGEVAFAGGEYRASLRGLHDLLDRRVGQTYTPECRHDCGDARCGVDLEASAVTGSVTSVLDERRFQDSARAEESGVFQDGKLVWLTGANAGASVEVSAWDSSERTFTLWLPMKQAIAVGDTYRVSLGCDKRFATCRARFNNGANFGGFPHLPGIGSVMGYP